MVVVAAGLAYFVLKTPQGRSFADQATSAVGGAGEAVQETVGSVGSSSGGGDDYYYGNAIRKMFTRTEQQGSLGPTGDCYRGRCGN